MKSLQDYIDTYRNIANNLNIRGDSAELLIQLLANASYVSEVENIAYSQEASLERATLVNSKIQHCVDSMYSVFRGTCPRVIFNIKPLNYQTLNPFDEIIVSNTFKVYYLGYYNQESPESMKSFDTGVTYASITLYPGKDTCKILCLIAREIVSEDWVISNNLYYLDCTEEDLSNDLWVTINKSGSDYLKLLPTTRQFSEHILDGKVFDLTLPSFGSRLYISGTNRSNGEESNWDNNHTITANYFKFSTLDTYNKSELSRLSMKGVELIPFEESWKISRNIAIDSEISTGIIPIKESSREDVSTIHYQANKDRFTSTIVRSNSDLASLFKETFPNKVGDTNVIYLSGDSSELTIYYVPKNNIELSEEELESFNSRKAYYISDNIEILAGTSYDVVFNIEVELYQGTPAVDEDIKSIINSYNKKFNTNFLESSGNSKLSEQSVLLEINTLISKLSNVKKIRSLTINYLSPTGESFNDNREGTNDNWNNMISDLASGKAYYNISCDIKSII